MDRQLARLILVTINPHLGLIKLVVRMYYNFIEGINNDISQKEKRKLVSENSFGATIFFTL